MWYTYYIMQKIINLRHQFGLSQMELAKKAKVSLATIQNLEAGKANPSLETIQKILSSLGSQFDISDKSTNIEMLNKLGLPLLVSEEIAKDVTVEILVDELKIAFKNYDKSEHRLKTVLESCYLALKSHYKSFFKKYFLKMPVMKEMDNIKITGQHLKFRRIIIGNFARYIK